MKLYDPRTRRLTISYLAVIMAMSIIFSCIIYGITSVHLGRPLPPPQGNQQRLNFEQFEERVKQRNLETKMSLTASLIALNAAVLAGGSVLSYYLARRTLVPIEDAIEQQAQFVSDASHELRTPLTALLTSNEVALRKRTLSEDKAREIIQGNIIEISKLQALSEALLGLARGPMVGHKESAWIDELVEDSIKQTKDVAEVREIKLINNMPHLQAVVNASAVTQVVTIFLDNAIKYSDDKSVVAVNGVQESGELKIQIKDEGIGIAEHDQQRIFERFYRADSSRTRSEKAGYGLGLAIAKDVADKNGYNIRVDSEVSKGTTITLAIPQK